MMCDRGADDTAQPDDDNLRLFRKPCHGARLRMILWQMAAAKQHRRRLAHNMQRRTLTLPPVCDTPRQRRDQCWAETTRSEEHTSELQSRENLVCRLLLEKKNAQ